ncbi:MAG TPA: DinB family protein [Cyclobacteriaceae bacterium]|nr:DinB family protein [Cyclobacteriaceae bacterium]
MTNSKILYYANRFNEIYNGSPWYGETVEVKLKGLAEEKAFVKPQGAHSVAELVAHMTYWRKGLIARLEGDYGFSPSVESMDNWTDISTLKARGWNKILDDFNHSQQKITQLLPKKNDKFLEEEYSPGSTFEYVIQGIIDHDVYHLGQIGLVRRFING